jgi:hypothetical protein
VLQAALQAAWAEILVETASSFHGLDSPSKAALSTRSSSSSSSSSCCHCCCSPDSACVFIELQGLNFISYHISGMTWGVNATGLRQTSQRQLRPTAAKRTFFDT